MATQPSLRIGDAEREAVAAELREHFAHGRLTLEEFNQRLDAVFAAKTQADLTRITRDLPHVRSWGSSLPSARTRPGPTMTTGPSAAGVVAGWTAGGEWHGRDRGGRRHGPGIGAFATLLAALATWLLVYDVILVGVRFPWPGRFGLLAVIFTLMRGLLRRIIRSPRRPW
jgi:DUF1707 SHOCT-like domain